MIQTGQHLQAWTLRRGAAITWLSTWSPSALQGNEYLQLRFTWWPGGLSTHETAKIQPHICPCIYMLILATAYRNPEVRHFCPHTLWASIYILSDLKTKQGKPPCTGTLHTQLCFSLVPLQTVVSPGLYKLLGTEVKSQFLAPQSMPYLMMSRAQGICPLPSNPADFHMQESCTIFILASISCNINIKLL